MKADRSYAKEIMDKCSILYCMKDEPMTQSAMCRGLECGSGWFSVIDEASCKLEAFNLIYYPKYKVRIQADQVKEKFGTLHFYFSVVCDDAEYTKEQNILITALDSWAEEIVQWAEKQCYQRCEECGRQIGTDWSPRCKTSGWITYICDDCAKKYNGTYFKNGEKWSGSTRLMTKKEVEDEQKKINEKIKENYKKENCNEDKT